MTQYLSSHTSSDPDNAAREREEGSDLADLRVFWGAEICRLEYLMHLLDTGRVKDENWPRSA